MVATDQDELPLCYTRPARMMEPHSPEPWRLENCYIAYGETQPDPRGHGTVSHVVARLMGTVLNNFKANALRIVGCVNGCKGIKNPETDVPELINLLTCHFALGFRP